MMTAFLPQSMFCLQSCKPGPMKKITKDMLKHGQLALTWTTCPYTDNVKELRPYSQSSD